MRMVRVVRLNGSSARIWRSGACVRSKPKRRLPSFGTPLSDRHDTRRDWPCAFLRLTVITSGLTRAIG